MSNQEENLIDVNHGTQLHKVHGDQKVFEQELENVFGRSWLFLTHESIIPNHGDYVVTKMGTDEVIVSRQENGDVKAFLNVCRHRGAQLCPHEAGNAKGFVCSYHGWGYGNTGELQSVPFDKEVYGGLLDKCKNSLHEVAKVENYNGFIYGCFDENSPSFSDYLGDLKWFLDPYFEHSGGLELIGPPARCLIRANWKCPAENFVGDAYHVGWTHASALRTGESVFTPLAGNSTPPTEGLGLQVTSKFGSGLGVLWDAYAGIHDSSLINDMMQWATIKEQQLAEKIGVDRARIYRSHLNTTIFPNNSFLTGSGVFKTWQPIDKDTTEVFTWTMVEKDMPEELKQRIAMSVQRTFGVAGYWESDDNDNMESETYMTKGFQARNKNLNAQMGIGNDVYNGKYPGVVSESAIGETSYRGYYRAYSAFINANSWHEIEDKSSNWADILTNAKTK